MNKNKETDIEKEKYKKKYKYKYPKTSITIGIILEIISFFYFLTELSFGVLDTVTDVLTSNGYRLEAFLIYFGVLLVLMLIMIIIYDIFIPESENIIKRDLEIEEIRKKYKIKRELKIYKERLKKIKEDE
jgi:membrane protein insertase Oxa1/YidC/SpoIIIJ